MRFAQRPVWSKGMLLSPQHLQSWDRFQESLLAARVGALGALDWGVLDLEIDVAALAAGQVRVVRFAGIMPDGLPVAFEAGEAGAPPPRALAERFPAAARACDVHLAVPREREGIPSFAREATATSRYVVADRLVANVADGGAAESVALARPNALLFLGDEPLEDHVAIRIARIVRNGAGQPALAERHVPPCLRLGGSPRLLSGIRDVLGRAIAKQRDLEALRGHRDAGGGAPSAVDQKQLLQLFALNEHIPVLTHLADTPDASPREAYASLVRLAGQLGTFGAGVDPAALPRFQHLELHDTFDPLLALLRSTLGAVAVAEHASIPLERGEGGLYLARDIEERLLRGKRFYLAVKSALPEAQVAESLPRLCKVSAVREIDALVRAAYPGLALQIVHRPPPQMPLTPGALYFSLASEERFWRSITADRELAIHLPPPFDPARTKVELVALCPATAESPEDA